MRNKNLIRAAVLFGYAVFAATAVAGVVYLTVPDPIRTPILENRYMVFILLVLTAVVPLALIATRYKQFAPSRETILSLLEGVNDDELETIYKIVSFFSKKDESKKDE